MIDIKTYITEGGFFANTGANKYLDTIKNFGNIIASGIAQKELKTARWVSNMPETDVYKKLYDLFNDINKYEVKFDVIYRVATSVLSSSDVCTEHWTGIRNGNKFSLSCDLTYEKHPEKNGGDSFEFEDVSEFLSKILYYLKDVRRLDILRNTAKFIVK